jgi:hydroxymethylbilane synthase
VRKAVDPNSTYDAIVLARAGVVRLGYVDVISQIIDVDEMLPAPGQGAIAVQTRDEAGLMDLLRPLHHAPTALAVSAERAFLEGLGGGCSVPVSAYAVWSDGTLVLHGRVSSTDGRRHIDVDVTRTAPDTAAARDAGLGLAREALERGAGPLLEARP